MFYDHPITCVKKMLVFTVKGRSSPINIAAVYCRSITLRLFPLLCILRSLFPEKKSTAYRHTQSMLGFNIFQASKYEVGCSVPSLLPFHSRQIPENFKLLGYHFHHIWSTAEQNC